MMEILAPAGSPESLQAAVRAGADAVYLGGGSFSARAFAHNFDDNALREAVRYCHARGVRVHLAVNTLLRDEEIERAVEFVRFACTLPVDAVLVQDTGLLLRLRECAPALPLHASTQMSLHTPQGAAAAGEAGMTRAVLSREMTAAELRETRGAVSIELESFVHGALCMSVSGQCYFSAMLGSRSGNRGMCAQTCRLPFSAPGGTGHDLSLKDLSLIPRLRELEDAGVMSAKIEGRMKRPEYVAAAVAACRRAADGEEIPPRLLENLEAVFSRSGFTTGFFDAPARGRTRPLFGTRSKEDAAAATGAVFGELHGLYREEYPRVAVHMKLTARAGEPVSLTVTDAEGFSATAAGAPPEAARTRPADPARCADQLKKTGGTPFYAGEVSCDLDEGIALPASALNALRREALASLLAQREERPPIPFTFVPFSAPAHPVREGALPLRARFPSARLPKEALRCELCFVPWDTKEDALSRLIDEGYSLALELPRGLFGLEREAARRLEAARRAGVTHCWAGNLGAVRLARELGFAVHGGFSLNITNTAALTFYERFGLTDTELSFELTLPQSAKIGGLLPRGLLVYGRQPLMLTRACPAANGPRGCLNCHQTGEVPVLTDRRGVRFPVQCTGACSEVLNSVPLELCDRPDELRWADFGVVRLTCEPEAEWGDILRRCFAGEPPAGEWTRGLAYRGIE